jgi:phosphoglycolate phosphatase
MANHPYDAVLFDLDGTLTRSEEGILNCVRYALSKMGRDVPQEQTLRSFIGPPLYVSFRDLCHMDDAECTQAVAFYRERYMDIGLFENAVYPGIRTLLRKLQKANVYLAVATGKPQVLTERILDHFGLSKFFQTVAGISEDDQEADKRQLIRRALPQNYKNAAMVGDRKFDMEGAKKMGIDGIGVTYGYGDQEELQNAGADHIALSVADLHDLLCPGMPAPKGFFLSVEGLDGSGKTTQVDLLEKHLYQWGFEVKRTREPGGCPISEKIRHVVLDIENLGMSATCEALLYAASRAQHVREVIRPSVEKGLVVLCDRFVDSSIAYQGGGRQLGVTQVAAINAPAVDGLMPDCTVYIDIDHEEALKRRGNAYELDRIEVEPLSFHARVEKAFRRLILENGSRYVTVDGNLSPVEIGARAFEAVLLRLYALEEVS